VLGSDAENPGNALHVPDAQELHPLGTNRSIGGGCEFLVQLRAALRREDTVMAMVMTSLALFLS
jgi:hypothetical protein